MTGKGFWLDMHYEIEVNGNIIYVTKKKIKNMYLRVRKNDGRIEVSVPLSMKDKDIIAFVEGKKQWIEEARGRIEKRVQKENDAPVLAPFQERELRYALKKKLENLIGKWEPVMNVKAQGFTIKKMKTRWGSCNVKSHHLNFNLALARVPEECVEYVVVHELTHLLEPSHNERFWKLMELYLPGSKELRKQLNTFDGAWYT